MKKSIIIVVFALLPMAFFGQAAFDKFDAHNNSDSIKPFCIVAKT